MDDSLEKSGEGRRSQANNPIRKARAMLDELVGSFDHLEEQFEKIALGDCPSQLASQLLLSFSHPQAICPQTQHRHQLKSRSTSRAFALWRSSTSSSLAISKPRDQAGRKKSLSYSTRKALC